MGVGARGDLRIAKLDRDPIRAFPRIQYGRDADRFWAVWMMAAQHQTPLGDLELGEWYRDWARAPVERVFEGLCDAVERVLAADPLGGTSIGSAVVVDYAARRGCALGSFTAYRFRDGKGQSVYDASLGAQWARDGVLAPMRRVSSKLHRSSEVYLTPNGPLGEGPDPVFAFDGAEALVVCTMPLAFETGWPPRDADGSVDLAFRAESQRDELVAVWRAPRNEPKR